VNSLVTATRISDPMGTVALESSSAPSSGGVIPTNAPFLRVDPQGSSANATEAVTNNKYFQFTLTPTANTDVDLTSLVFDVARGGAGTPRGYAVRSSADNFGANLATADILTVRPDYTPVTVDLSSAAFQNIQNLTGGLTFRIYSYSPNGGASVDYDNITLNGTAVAVPEPVGLALLALGGASLLGRRRKLA
jgi:hypothetical protein